MMQSQGTRQPFFKTPQQPGGDGQASYYAAEVYSPFQDLDVISSILNAPVVCMTCTCMVVEWTKYPIAWYTSQGWSQLGNQCSWDAELEMPSSILNYIPHCFYVANYDDNIVHWLHSMAKKVYSSQFAPHLYFICFWDLVLGNAPQDQASLIHSANSVLWITSALFYVIARQYLLQKTCSSGYFAPINTMALRSNGAYNFAQNTSLPVLNSCYKESVYPVLNHLAQQRCGSFITYCLVLVLNNCYKEWICQNLMLWDEDKENVAPTDANTI